MSSKLNVSSLTLALILGITGLAVVPACSLMKVPASLSGSSSSGSIPESENSSDWDSYKQSARQADALTNSDFTEVDERIAKQNDRSSSVKDHGSLDNEIREKWHAQADEVVIQNVTALVQLHSGATNSLVWLKDAPVAQEARDYYKSTYGIDL